MKTSFPLVVSYKLNLPEYGQNKPFGKKVFTTQIMNSGNTKEQIQAKGIHTELEFGPDNNQEYVARTLRIAEGLRTDEELRNGYLSWYLQYGLTKNSLMSDEFLENSQGQDPNISTRCVLAYKEVFEYLQSLEPGLHPRDTNIIGGYGVDNLDGLFNPYMLDQSEAEVLAWLTDHVHDARNINTGTWGRVNFYSAEHYKYRNANLQFYLYEGAQRYFVIYDMLLQKERLSVGTQTIEPGVDREVDAVIFATTNIQTLVRNEQGGQIGVEEGRKQDVIRFNNGIIKAYVSHAWIETVQEYSFWAPILFKGVFQWGSLRIGLDGTKMRFHPDFNVGYNSWTPDGGSEELYQSGVNGAPIRSEEGVNPYLATIIDASYAAWYEGCRYVNRTANLYYADYSSSRKSFTAAPGSAGYNVNGFGPLNTGQKSSHKAYREKKGVALIGTGPDGNCAFYQNLFLLPDEEEHNVIVTRGALSYNFGAVRGGEIKHAMF